jgi:Ser/Thr protein kinase RdoA (MazF antagonist)/SAM-dependent methyltransferase
MGAGSAVGPEPSDGRRLLARLRSGMPVLGTARSTTFVAGSNVKGRVAGANWWFVLPRLEAEAVLCVGTPSEASLATLAAMTGRVTVVTRRGVTRGAGTPDNVSFVRARTGGPLPLADAAFDVAFCSGGGEAHRVRDELLRVLKPSGIVFVEGREARFRPRRRPELPGSRSFRLAPAIDEAKALAPTEDREAAALVADKVRARAQLSRRHAPRTLSLVARQAVAGWVSSRFGLLAAADGSKTSPLEYLRRIAGAGGIDLGEHRWALAAPGDYASQKIVVYLLDAEGRPAYVAKLTRGREWNERLENERRALTLLDAASVAEPGTRPLLAFHGTAAGLAVVGETAVDGTPFTTRSAWTATCPHGRAAVAWLRELARATADSDVAKPAEVAEALDDLADRFVSVYASPAREEAFLREQIDRFRRSTRPFPVVLQHGDPGPWNLLATASGGVAFLDWEAAEPNGLPLWDLFYFLRSYGMAASRSAGRRDPTASFAEHYVTPSPLADVLTETIAGACSEIGLDPALVEPLFYTCWMHRALKEATRLRPEQLDKGRFVRLLRYTIASHDARMLQCLFAARV